MTKTEVTATGDTTAVVIRRATELEIAAALSRINYRSEFAKALDSLPEDVPGLVVTGRAIQSVRVAVSVFNKRRNDNRRFRVTHGNNGDVLVQRARV